MAIFVLSSSEANSVTEKWSYQQDTIYPSGVWSFEIVLIFLTKKIAIHMRFFWIDFWGLSFK